MSHNKYYRRSSHALLPYALAVALAVGGCAHVNDTAARALRVSLADLDGPDRGALAQRLGREPVVIHLAEGDRIPVALDLDSPILALGGARDLVLTAQRDLYLLLHDGPPLLSTNGRDFEPAGRNYFMFGITVKQGEPTTLQLKVGIRPDYAWQAPNQRSQGDPTDSPQSSATRPPSKR